MPYKLTPKQRKAARLMAEGELDIDIEERFKLQFNTLERWKRIPAFQDCITRHARNLKEVVPHRMQAMKTLSISAACAELAYQPDSKILQQVCRVMEYTDKLTRMKINALDAKDETMMQMVKDTEKMMAPQLLQELTNAAEKAGIDLNASKRRQNAPNASKISLTNPEATHKQVIDDFVKAIYEAKDNPEL